MPLINGDYIEDIEIKVTKENVKWYLNTTKERLDIINKYIKNAKAKNKKQISDKIAYTLILRIRTFEIIKKMMQNKDYSKKEFIKLIKNISKSENAYNRYLAVKDNSKEKNMLTLSEAENLYRYLEKDLSKVKKML